MKLGVIPMPFLIILVFIIWAVFPCRALFRRDMHKTRGDISKELITAEKRFVKQPQDNKTQYAYAKLLYTLGKFEKSKDLILPLAASPQATLDSRNLLAELEYLSGNYQAAADIMQKEIQDYPDDIALKIMSQVKLVFIYYQMNRYDKVGDLFKEGKIELPIWELMKSFDVNPYHITWNTTGEHTTEILFIKRDPLPVLPVTVNGKEISVIIDTGGDSFILDSALAESMNIKPVASAVEGGFAGGKETLVKFAAADSLQLGGVTLAHIPMMMLPTERWSNIFGETDVKIQGVVGTQVLKQFLATIDYRNNKLILRSRDDTSLQQFINGNRNRKITAIPFFMALTHYMIITSGKVNHATDMTLLVDSGLADANAAFASPPQTLHYLNIPEPPLMHNGFGGGDALFKAGHYDISSLSISSAKSISTKGVAGIMPKEWYRGFGQTDAHDFIVDGLVSHNYLKNFSVTFDFAAMTIYLVE